MIEITDVSKCFGQVRALDHITASIGEGHVFGLVGTNGAGKSTLFRILCGVCRPDSGAVTVDGGAVYDNPEVKALIFYLSDDQYFYSNGTPEEMMNLYRIFYPAFDTGRFGKLLEALKLDRRRKINTFSKGMKKQLAILFGICSGAKYLLCDETFDGLDPVMRQTVKSLFIQEMEQRKMTPVIASHNLRELEDICDHVGLLHEGGILLSKDLEEMKLDIHKLQCVLREPEDYDALTGRLKVLKDERRGGLMTLTLRGVREEIDAVMREFSPVYYELLPLSLEEIFISETEVKGYDFKNLIL